MKAMDSERTENKHKNNKKQSKKNLRDFKGVHYNKEKQVKYFEHGAHFKYEDLYNILESLSRKQNQESNLETAALTYSHTLKVEESKLNLKENSKPQSNINNIYIQENNFKTKPNKNDTANESIKSQAIVNEKSNDKMIQIKYSNQINQSQPKPSMNNFDGKAVIEFEIGENNSLQSKERSEKQLVNIDETKFQEIKKNYTVNSKGVVLNKGSINMLINPRSSVIEPKLSNNFKSKLNNATSSIPPPSKNPNKNNTKPIQIVNKKPENIEFALPKIDTGLKIIPAKSSKNINIIKQTTKRRKKPK